MKRLFASLFFLLSANLFADSIGIVQKVHGIVKVKHENSIKKEKVKVCYEIQKGDIITTYAKSNAVLKREDGSHVVLDARSTIRFDGDENLSQEGGKVFYKIIARNARHKLHIKTSFAIIGIKGTTFIVGSEQNSSFVALKEGVVGIQSIKEAFELYKKKVLDEYEAFVRKQQQEFEKFKKQQEDYIVEQTEAFDLEAGKIVSFKGNKAIEDPLESEKEFEKYERMLEE